MDVLRDKISDYGKKLWKPDKIKKKRLKTNSWFDMSIGYNKRTVSTEEHTYNVEELPKPEYECKKIILLPTETQRKILLKWMDVYTRMYNETLKVIKREFYNKRRMSLNFRNVRTYYMLEQKEKLYKISGIQPNEKDTRINKHILDQAIKDVCTSYLSAITNLKRGIIKHFRIRYIKQTKPQKIMKIEKILFSKNGRTFCGTVLGDHMATIGDCGFSDISFDCTLMYNKLNNTFIMLVPVLLEEENQENAKYDAIGLDPGVRTFMTGYSEGHTLDIGTNLYETIKKELREIDKINKSELPEKKRRKAENKRYYKINNLIDDLHWKTITHLVTKYQTILIGNLSTNKIGRNTGTNRLCKMVKRVASMMRLYVFTERLKYKCSIKKRDYGMINERYTSKMCTFCGNIKEDLGTNKVYECKVCKRTIERDVNGARNIYLLGLE